NNASIGSSQNAVKSNRTYPSKVYCQGYEGSLKLFPMKVLFTNIKELLQTRDASTPILKGEAMKDLPTVKDAYLLIEDEKISQYGSMDKLPAIEVDEKVDLRGRMVLPSWCDSHTHLVYAGNREQEFIDRINGLSY